MKKFVLTIACFYYAALLFAQPDRWQQRVKYSMDINMDVTTNRFTGKQKLEYTNNSPDTLHKLFYHLHWNAFQPNSMMDTRSRRQGTVRVGRNNNADWDGRVQDRIVKLTDAEIGYQKILSFKMNGVAQPYTMHETILEVKLTKPIAPKSKAVLDMDFEAQVPLQVRRSGRDNPTTGVRYSMSQWYPKLCEYDYEGWHPTPYVGREFYGVWGDFDVKITIDKNYMLGGTGYLQNANQIGFGYEAPGTKVPKPAGNTLTWQFTAPNVHDFMWAADPDYKHITRTASSGVVIHVLYDGKTGKPAEWQKMADAAVTVLPFIEKRFGPYPYKQYSFIHGGDGGMEYPMGTLLVGSSLGTAFHEWMHSWYQMMLGTNEGLYAWMDEGFTEFGTNLVELFFASGGTDMNMSLMDNGVPVNAHESNYNGYFSLVKSGLEEPLSTHADHFNTNYAYSSAAYNKGCVFMEQLGYIIGGPQRNQLLLDYYDQWRFKHPNAADLIRLAEKRSGLKLDWYKEYFVNSTKTIDYGIDSLWEEGGKTKIRLRKVGLMPMPVDCMLTFADGSRELHYVPMYLMFGGKPTEYQGMVTKNYEAWKWTHGTYIIETTRNIKSLKLVEIDPSQRMADVERKNNKLELTW
jgi:hypothetical protein